MTPMAQSTSSVIPRSNFESMTDSTLNSATATVDEDRDSPTEAYLELGFESFEVSFRFRLRIFVNLLQAVTLAFEINDGWC